MTSEEIWNCDATVAETIGEKIPAWIDQDICVSTIASIVQGGCASGAYMPAVTYWRALQSMNDYGDEVLDYIQDQLGEMPTHCSGESWAGMACFYLSYAIELWAGNVFAQLEGAE